MHGGTRPFAAWWLLFATLAAPALAAPPVIDEATGDYGDLTLRFDQPMVTWDGESTAAQLVVTPAAPCRWYWEDDTTLSCTTGVGPGFEERLRAATVYRVAVSGLWSQSGEALAPTEVRIVHGAPELAATLDAWHDDWPTIGLRSDEAVTATAIARSLDLIFRGEPLPYRLEPRAPRPDDGGVEADTVFYTLTPTHTPSGPGPLKLRLRAGLASPLGDALGAGRELLDVAVGAPFAVTGVHCHATAEAWQTAVDTPCAPEKPIYLVFNRPLSPASVDTIRAALPAGVALLDAESDCSWQCARDPRRPSHVLELESATAGHVWTLRLPAGLQSVDGDTIGAPFERRVTMTSWAPGYRIEPPVRLGLPGATTPAIVEARNLPAGDRWIEVAIGADVERRERRVGRTRPAEAFAPVRTPPVAEAVLRDGGLSLGGSQQHRGAARATAVAPFDVLVGQAGRQTLAWASEWADGAAVAGASVELLEVAFDGATEVLASGRTDADGVARLEAATVRPMAYGADAVRVVRVMSGERVAVVPVLAAARLALSDPGDDVRTDELFGFDDAARQFGVTGRLLYRPGETVEYRLWPRRRVGNRLMSPEDTTALPLELVGHGEVALRAWTAGLDEWGSVHGTVVLPTLLADGEYCVMHVADPDDRYSTGGACFQVARFADQALWAELTANAPVLRGGDRLALAIRGGYYSGGAAAGALLRVQSLVMPADFADAYPAFAGYSFAGHDAGSVENDPLQGLSLPERLDGAGTATIAATLPARMLDEAPPADGAEPRSMPFALMQFNAAVRTDGDAEASSPTARVYFAEFGRYVGLKIDRWWLPLDADPVLDAVVATHAGDALPGTPVQVRIESGGDDEPQVLARCTLVAGTPSPCPFRAPRAGLYAFVAESADAAPVRILRWFGASAPDTDADADDAMQLTLLRAFDDMTPARIRVVQPHARAVALFVLEYDEVLATWTQPLGPQTDVDVPLQAAWAPGVTLRVFVRPATGDAAAGLAAPTLERSLVLAIPRAARDAVAFTITDATLAPGEDATLELHNGGDRARLLTIAIVDDSVHQQVAWLHDFVDPDGGHFLGSLATWDGTSWLGLHGWKNVPNLFHDPDSARPKRERIVAAPAPAPEPIGTVPGNGTFSFDGESTTLDSIEVTGSRLKGSEIFVAQPARERVDGAPGQRPGLAMARVRSRFPDAAYWNPGIVLAPGERRTLAVPLPDNLTRWRVLVWSSDAGDEFALAQSTLTTSLPVELRLGLPDHLYDGDTSSGTVSARAATGAATLSLQATADGAGVTAATEGRGTVAAHALLSRDLALAPVDDGEIGVVARANSAAGGDAVSGRIPVHSRWATRTLPQAGWLDGSLRLPLPPLADGARDPRLALTVSLGAHAWRDGWIAGLRDYPHRCWEQTLSRGLGAALALADPHGRAAWPEAAAVVQSAFAEAPTFRDADGRYHFFPPQQRRFDMDASPTLNAWTVRAFGLLEELGQPAPAWLVEDFEFDLELDDDEEPERELVLAAAQLAAARAASGDPFDDDVLLALRAEWDVMDWHARSELVRALAAAPALAAEAGDALAKLRDAGEARGLRRVVADARDFGWAMGSSLRDQCAVTATLWDLDRDPATLGRRRAFLRGVQDLYAGGTPSLDTQASVHCLLALRAAARAGEGAADGQLVATLGAASAQLRVDAATPVAQWQTPVPVAPAVPAPSPATLELATPAGTDATLSYVAELRFEQDLRDAEPTAVGLQLQRRYAVLRDGAWTPVSAGGVREGDWIRVTLQVTAPAWRHFVAITDPVPGGWTTRDLRLEGVGGAAMRALGDPGSWWFDERQTGSGEVRLYAEALPPGTHDVHYFAQAVHAGTYFAPPATAELMYGRSSRATTAPAQVRIGD